MKTSPKPVHKSGYFPLSMNYDIRDLILFKLNLNVDTQILLQFT